MHKQLKDLVQSSQSQGSHSASERMSVEEKKSKLSRLSELQIEVTQFSATERPFANAYWDHEEEGIYVDVISGKPLFSSREKFDAGCGWPSFSSPIEADEILYEVDKSHFMERIEVKSRFSEAHLGHVFDDGIEPTGLRYCINSASLRFIPKEQMEALGYGDYLYLFED